jgi:hypothetical protein
MNAALILHLLRGIQREHVRLAAMFGALADTLEQHDAPVCQSYGSAREDGERRASHSGHEAIDDG